MAHLADTYSQYLLVYGDPLPFFPYAVYMSKKRSHLSCRISHIVPLVDHVPKAAAEWLAHMSDTAPCVTVPACVLGSTPECVTASGPMHLGVTSLSAHYCLREGLCVPLGVWTRL